MHYGFPDGIIINILIHSIFAISIIIGNFLKYMTYILHLKWLFKLTQNGNMLNVLYGSERLDCEGDILEDKGTY